MAEVSIKSSSFPLFSSLAPELRDQIWREALPDEVGLALYFWKKGCWQTWWLPEDDIEYIHRNPEANLMMTFRHELLDHIQFEVPLAFVNREARHIAVAWLHKHGIEMRICKNERYPIFTRAFDPVRDALYVALDQRDDFLMEVLNRLFTDLFETMVSVGCEVRCIAVPETLLHAQFFTQETPQNGSSWLNVLFDLTDFSNIRKLLVIIDEPADLQFADNDLKVQRRWEFQGTQGGSFIWNKDHGSFDFEGRRYNGDEALYVLMEEMTKEVKATFIAQRVSCFEIQPVFAIKK